MLEMDAKDRRRAENRAEKLRKKAQKLAKPSPKLVTI